MSKQVDEEARIHKRIAKAEKKAMRYAGLDEGLVQRFWELVNMFPKISTPQLEDRLEKFILNATGGQYFTMQQALFEQATPYLIEDPRVRRLMHDLKGKKLGLRVKGEYESTVTIGECYFQVERGIRGSMPVISCESRRDYADSILGLLDPIKLILGRRIRASHKLTLLRWGLPHLDLLRDRDLFEKYLDYQEKLEKALEENLEKMGY